MTTLRETRYGFALGRPKEGIVQYVIQNGNCIFSGITKEYTSTINAAEQIIEAIAEAERIDPRTLTFFDLRTTRGYSDIAFGEYELLRLAVTYKGRKPKDILSWKKAPCPEYAKQLFGVNLSTDEYPVSDRVAIGESLN